MRPHPQYIKKTGILNITVQHHAPIRPMNISQFVLCQPWAVQLPEESWHKLRESSGGSRLTCVHEHGMASFAVASLSVSFSAADEPSPELQANVGIKMWIAETMGFPAALIIQFSDDFYFIDHTMLRSLSIQRNKKKSSQSRSQLTPGCHVLCFCWPLELEMTLSLCNGDKSERSTVVEQLNEIVCSMSTMLTKKLSTDPLFYSLWKSGDNQDDEEEIRNIGM